jgi:branched-subunit amino acid ABC-type transport system permease component
MLGALVIGLVLQLSSLVIPSQYSQDIVFGILFLVLLVRPQGLLQVVGKSA